MKESFMERVHLCIGGIEGYEVPGVENIFAEGAVGLKLYSEAMDAYQRICDRLGVMDEDDDLEIIVNNMIAIEKEFSCRMYRYGAQFGMREE